MEELWRQWEEARVTLRDVLKTPQDLANFDSVEGGLEEGDLSLESIPDHQEEEAVDEGVGFSRLGPIELDFENGEDVSSAALSGPSEAIVDARNAAYLPPPGEELVFEAVAGTKEDSNLGKAKLSREERIKAMKEGRKSSSSGGGVPSGKGRIEPGMVQELKDVLKLLKGRASLPAA